MLPLWNHFPDFRYRYGYKLRSCYAMTSLESQNLNHGLGLAL